MAFCQKCGNELPSGAQFCGKCGTPAGATGAEIQQGETQRKTFFAGNVLKCPHCGTSVDGNTVICPSCGTKLSNSGSTYVQRITAEIARINKEYEAKKRDAHASLAKMGVQGMLKSAFMGGGGELKTEANIELERKNAVADFIDGIAIPTSIVDILDLFVYVKGQVGKIKKTSFLDKLLDTSSGGNRTDDSAWISLLDSIYTKASMTFPNEPEFKKLEEQYRSIRKK